MPGNVVAGPGVVRYFALQSSFHRAGMTLFDLVFIVVFFVTVGSLVVSMTEALRGRRNRAAKRLRALGVGLALYMGAVAVSSLLAPRQVLALGEPACSDDW